MRRGTFTLALRHGEPIPVPFACYQRETMEALGSALGKRLVQDATGTDLGDPHAVEGPAGAVDVEARDTQLKTDGPDTSD
jgi:hypothetical protein